MIADPDTPGTRRRPAIADYGFLSDCHSAALVDRQGSVDWWCVPRFDSPSVFGRLLDPAAGHWTLHPGEDFRSERHYVGDTLVVCTIFRTATGEVAVTDTLALEPGARGHEIGLRSPHTLLRTVVGRSGVVRMHTELAPRLEYGCTQPHLRAGAGGLEFRGGPVQLSCTGPVSWQCADGIASATFPVAAGQTVELRLTYSSSFGATAPADGDSDPTLQDTLDGWDSWSALHTSYDGAFPDQVRRSSLILQGLTFQPSGAVVAAATTSLPERLGGEDNFDYRFAWLRDLSLTIRALWVAACPDEPARLFDWFANAAGHIGDEPVQIMYGVEGERDLTEHVLEHLAGYRDSAPVRVGNQAWEQRQLDVLGEVLDAAFLLREQLGELERPVRDMLVTLANRAAAGWAEPDAGMWESREKPRQYVSSKMMCWVALDRAVQLAPVLGPDADPARWAAARDEVHAAILEQAWSSSAGAYAGAFASDDLDASVLLMPLVGFLPATDERMWATIEAIERELGTGGLVRRWPDDPSGFLICTYWLVECLAMGGASDRATSWFRGATAYANDLGLLSEEADPDSGELLGNYPQTFSHVGLINAAWRLAHPEPDSPRHDHGTTSTTRSES
ncbi:MAG: glycoside hydrolase family 15 protein [Pseudonocardia sp.]